MNEKRSVVLYPEGTSQRCGAPIGDFYSGTFDNAYKNNLPIQPISLRYTRDIGHGKEDKPTLWDFFSIIDLTIVCEPGDVIVKKITTETHTCNDGDELVTETKEESFKDYFARAQASITPGLYYEM